MSVLVRLLFVLMITLIPAAAVGDSGAKNSETVELNKASVTELMQLPGIGRQRAIDIIRRRTQRPFRRTSDLLRIRGIGRRTYFKLKPFVRVDPVTPRGVEAQR